MNKVVKIKMKHGKVIAQSKNTLILDCELRSALACVRSLGKHKKSLVLASTLRYAPTFYSKYARTYPKVIYPDPVNNVNKYTDAIRTICDRYNVGLIIPMGEPTLLPILHNRDSTFSDIQIPVPATETFKELLNKDKVLRLAEICDINVPTIWTVNEYDKIESREFPLILKPYYSVTINNNGLKRYGVKWIKSKDELLKVVDGNSDIEKTHFLQQYIEGHGGALYFLFWNGQYVSHLEQITLAQQVGPGSVVRALASNSIYPQEVPKFKRMLENINWHGVIMLEIRRNIKNGKSYLIEANPRFWGPLQLAVDAGIDFPWLLYSLCMGNTTPNNTFIEANTCGYTWLTGALMSTILQKSRIKNDPIKPSKHNLDAKKFRDVRFKDLYFRRDDPVPALFNLYDTIVRPVNKKLMEKIRFITIRTEI